MIGDVVVFGVVVPDLAIVVGAIAGLWFVGYACWLVVTNSNSGR